MTTKVDASDYSITTCENPNKRWYDTNLEIYPHFNSTIERNQYYDILTGEFVGENIKARYDALAINKITESMIDKDKSNDITALWHQYYRFDVNLNYIYDSNFYDGNYGYGSLLPDISIMPLSDIIDTKYINKDTISFLTSNSDESIKAISEKIYLEQIDVIKKYEFEMLEDDFIHNMFGVRQDILYALGIGGTASRNKILYNKDNSKYKIKTKQYLTNQLSLCVCTKKDGTKDTFVGYRCSVNKEEMGYQQFYDVVSGNIIKIENFINNDYEDTKIELYEGNKNLYEIIGKYGSFDNQKSTMSGEQLSNINKSLNNEPIILIKSDEEFSSQSTSGYIPDKYHILISEESHDIYDGYSERIYQDIKYPNAKLIMYVDENSEKIDYIYTTDYNKYLNNWRDANMLTGSSLLNKEDNLQILKNYLDNDYNDNYTIDEFNRLLNKLNNSYTSFRK